MKSYIKKSNQDKDVSQNKNKFCEFHGYLIWKTQQKANDHLKRSNLTSYHYFSHKTIETHQYNKFSHMQNGWNVKNVQQHSTKKGRKHFAAWMSGGMMLVLKKKTFGIVVSKNDTLFFLPPKVAFFFLNNN